MGAVANFKVGEQVRVRLFMKTCDVRKTNTKPPRDYLSTTLTDGVDDLDGKVWNYVNVGNLPEAKKSYDVVGTIGEYQGKKQITITDLKLSSDQDTSAFIVTLGYTADELWDAVSKAISAIKNDTLQTICATVYATYRDVLLRAPSAKAVHHAGAGGNIIHTIEVFNLASSICDNYGPDVINKPLAQAGALLHDIGKAYVYEIEGPAIDYTYAGHLHDHIVTGIRMLDSTAQWPEEQKETIDLLTHIIAAHHGKMEYGSPVTPKCLEAYIVNIADGISATVDTILTANIKAPPTGNITDRIYTNGNVPNIKQSHIQEVIK